MIRSTPQSDSLDRCFRTWCARRPRRDDRASRRAASRGVCACQAQGECLPEPVVKILRCDKRTFPGIALAVTISFWAAVAPAADLANTGTDQSSAGVLWLLGDWDGARTRLKAAGVDFQLGYVGEIAGNAAGGLRRQAAYADQWVTGVTLDLGRLSLLRDGSVQLTFSDRNGRNLSDDAGLGTLQEVQEIYGHV